MSEKEKHALTCSPATAELGQPTTPEWFPEVYYDKFEKKKKSEFLIVDCILQKSQNVFYA